MYFALALTDEIRYGVQKQWDTKASEFNDLDKTNVANDDTKRSLFNCDRYTHIIEHRDTGEFVALVGIVQVKTVNCHKVLDLKLNPSSNPDYRDEQEIGMISVSEDIVGAIVALTTESIFESQMSSVKIFGRGHDMKTFFNLVVEQVSKAPINGLEVCYEAGWLVIKRK